VGTHKGWCPHVCDEIFHASFSALANTGGGEGLGTELLRGRSGLGTRLGIASFPNFQPLLIIGCFHYANREGESPGDLVTGNEVR